MKANEAPETYPMQFRDKTDEYLWKEHHILGGCCSSTESMKYAVAREVAEKLTDAFIEKAAEWMVSQASVYSVTHVSNDGSIYTYFYADKMVEDFRKYMEGE